MKRMTIAIVMLLMITQPYIANACEQLSIDNAVQLALDNNKTLKQAEQEKEAAYSKIIQARAGFMPEIQASGTYIFTYQLPILTIPPNAFGPKFPSTAINTRINFSTWNYTAGFNASWTLFAGGMIWNNYNASKYLYESSSASEQDTRQEIIYQVKRAYYDFLLAKESVSIIKHSIVIAKEHFKNTENRYSAGEASELDVLNANVSLANLQPQVIAAENNVKITELNLKNLLGVEFTDNVCGNADVPLPQLSNSLGQFQKDAEQKNYQLKSVEKQIKASADYKRVSLGRFIPSLTVGGYYNWLSNDFGTWQPIYQAELVLSIPLFSGGSDIGKVKEANADYYRLTFLKSQIKDTIRLSIEGVYSSAVVAEKELKAAEYAVNTAQKAESIAEEQYRIGTAINIDVLNADLALREAQINYVKAKYNYLTAIAELDRITGIGK